MSRPRPRGPRGAERLPLRLRLPNPPPVFVGRRREADALEAAIRRAPLTCVVGFGGLGKSALTFHVLHTRFPAEVPRTLVVRLTPDESVDHALLEVARAVAEVGGITGVDWRALLGDREALVATAIDLVEGAGSAKGGRDAAPFWVVLDDLHHADPARAGHVLELLARYARRGRWIAISRTNPAPGEAAGQAIALKAMASEDLLALAAGWDGGAVVDDRVVGAAAGSPWRLKQLLAGAQPGLEPGAGDPFDGLPAEAVSLLLDLSLVDGELTEQALSRFTALPSQETLDALERRGLVERQPQGLRLHDVARALVSTRMDASARRDRAHRAAHALADAPEEAVWLEGLRLLIAEGEAEEAARALDERGAALLDTAHVLSLWRVLERATAPELASWRLRCATEIGGPPTLRGVPLPAFPSAADRARWALSLFQQGRYEDASVAGEAALAAAVEIDDAALAFDVRRTIARAALDRGDVERALALFEAQVPTTPRQAAQRDVDIAASLVSAERRPEALLRVRAVEAAIAERPELGDGSLHHAVAWVLYQLGELHLAERAAERLTAAVGAVRLHGLASARYLFLHAGLAYDRGALPRAAALLEKLEPLARRSPAYVAFVGIQRVQLRLASGELEGLAGEVDRVRDAAARTSRDDLVAASAALRHRLALALGEPPAAPPSGLGAGEHPQGDQLLLWEAIHHARHGAVEPDPVEVRSEVPEVRILALLARAEVALAGARATGAARLAAEAADLAARQGYGVLEALARATETAACAVSEAPEAELLASARRLDEIARERVMPPLVAQAELLSLVAGPSRFDPARLQALAERAGLGASARQARALLGDDAALDALDAALVGAARRRTRLRVESVARASALDASAGAPRAAWYLDERSSTVWLPGRSCSLADRALLWRILTVLADAGGAADKEAIVLGAWQQRDYHPLRDDGRLHTAVRTLRRLIEDDPANPARVVTTPSGYALGRAAPARRIVPAGNDA